MLIEKWRCIRARRFFTVGKVYPLVLHKWEEGCIIDDDGDVRLHPSKYNNYIGLPQFERVLEVKYVN